MDNDFNIWVPMELDIIKSGDGKTQGKMMIKGVASTADIDTDDQTLEPTGFVLDRLLKSGYLNYDHRSKDDPMFIIGEPTLAEIRKGELYVEGELYNTELAKSVYEFGNVLASSNSKRRLGMSIEGKVLAKDPFNPKRITKSLITGIAITPTPKNANTYVDLIKGFRDDFYVDNYEFDLEKSIEGNDVILEHYDENSGQIYTIDKDLNLIKRPVSEIKKSIDLLLNASKSGQLSREQIESFKKSLIRLKNLKK